MATIGRTATCAVLALIWVTPLAAQVASDRDAIRSQVLGFYRDDFRTLDGAHDGHEVAAGASGLRGFDLFAAVGAGPRVADEHRADRRPVGPRVRRPGVRRASG